MTLLMLAILAAVCLQILSRYTGLVPRYIWTEEAARFCFVWIVMAGSIVAVRDGTHFDVDLMPAAKTVKEKLMSRLVVHTSMLLMAMIFAWYGVEFARFGGKQLSEMSGINMASIYVSFPLAGVSWALFLIEKIIVDLRQLLAKPHLPVA